MGINANKMMISNRINDFVTMIFDLETPLESPLSELVTLSPKFDAFGIPSLQRDFFEKVWAVSRLKNYAFNSMMG